MPTVQQLIEALEKVPNKNMLVLVEGCDCYGEWNGVVSRPYKYDDAWLLIERSND